MSDANPNSSVEAEFSRVLREIVEQNWTAEQWARHEAGDWFQTEHFNGGFEADESYQGGTFNFSYYDESRKEWWFTFSLQEVKTLLTSGFRGVLLIDPNTFDYGSIGGPTTS